MRIIHDLSPKSSYNKSGNHSLAIRIENSEYVRRPLEHLLEFVFYRNSLLGFSCFHVRKDLCV